MKSSDAKTSKCPLEFSSRMIILFYLLLIFVIFCNEDYLLIVI